MRNFRRKTDGKVFKWKEGDSNSILRSLLDEASFEEIFEIEEEEDIIEENKEEIIKEITEEEIIEKEEEEEVVVETPKKTTTNKRGKK